MNQPMAKPLSANWHQFWTSPVPLPSNLTNLDDISEHGNTQLRSVMESAVQSGVLPHAVLLAHFVHVIPEDVDINLEIPTLVNRHHAAHLLLTSAIQGHFVEKTKLSFFREAMHFNARAHKGLICSISRNQPCEVDIGDETYTYATVKKAYEPLMPAAFEAAVCQAHWTRIGKGPWDYIRGADLYPLISQVGEAEPCHPGFCAEASPQLRALLGERTKEYLWHVSPWTQWGHIVLCAPLFCRQDRSVASVAGVGGGGVVFVVKGRLSRPLLRDLYTISHRMCGIVSGIWDIARAISRRAEAVGYQHGEYTISHELDTPVGILDLERERLTEDGGFALDYLELWRRFVKREWSESLPDGLELAFRTNGAFLQRMFLLAYVRASFRNLLPKRISEERQKIAPWSREEMLRHFDRWIDVVVDIPDTVRTGGACWAYQAQCWLMFFVIGGLHHAIKYAFRNASAFSDWTAANRIRRAAIEVSHIWKDDRLTICIQDAGEEVPPSLPVTCDYLQSIRSNHLGTIRLPPVDGFTVSIEPFKAVGKDDLGRQLWLAQIVVQKEEQLK